MISANLNASTMMIADKASDRMHAKENEESLDLNKGLDWTPSQWVAGAAGFLASAGVAQLLVSQGYATRNWAVILMLIGLGAPPAVVGWLAAKKRQKREVS